MNTDQATESVFSERGLDGSGLEVFMRRWLAVVAVVMGAAAAWGGTAGDLVCGNKECNYTEQVSFGGGFLFEQVTGRCQKCSKFTSITWDRTPRTNRAPGTTRPARPRPQTLGSVWIAASGEVVSLYACPDCRGPFIAVIPDQIRHCPRCGKEEIKFERKEMFD